MKRSLEIVMVTGDRDTTLRPRAENLGVNHFFHKQTQFDQFCSWGDGQRGKHLVLVDDDPGTLESMVDWLNFVCPASIHTFTSAAEALQMITELQPPVDVVVTDFQMPGMNGLELTRQLREIFPRE